jgi:hypothetical protein
MQKNLPGPLCGNLAGWRAASHELPRKTQPLELVLWTYYRLIVSLVVTVWPALSVTDNVSIHGALPETR